MSDSLNIAFILLLDSVSFSQTFRANPHFNHSMDFIQTYGIENDHYHDNAILVYHFLVIFIFLIIEYEAVGNTFQYSRCLSPCLPLFVPSTAFSRFHVSRSRFLVTGSQCLYSCFQFSPVQVFVSFSQSSISFCFGCFLQPKIKAWILLYIHLHLHCLYLGPHYFLPLTDLFVKSLM